MEAFGKRDFSEMCACSLWLASIYRACMAFATPCIVTDLVDTDELLGNPAFVVPAGRIVELPNRALDVINSAPDERHTLGKKAFTGVKKHYCL